MLAHNSNLCIFTYEEVMSLASESPSPSWSVSLHPSLRDSDGAHPSLRVFPASSHRPSGGTVEGVSRRRRCGRGRGPGPCWVHPSPSRHGAGALEGKGRRQGKVLRRGGSQRPEKDCLASGDIRVSQESRTGWRRMSASGASHGMSSESDRDLPNLTVSAITDTYWR